MYNRTNVPPSTSGASGAPGFNNQPNPIPLPNVQGNFQNQPVNVVAGPSSYLNPQVQQFTQPQALPPLNWSNATVGAPLIVPGMHRHPHMIVAGTVADFVGETISLDAFTEGRAKQELLDEFTKYFANLNLSSGAQAQQGASTSTLPLTGNQIQQVRQQVESDIRTQA